ncbi:MAG: short-chain dehydrogenase [Gemmatimonadetes bacterium]|nr:short-chain dehydrogenase [Gemmatimonadota bacterium]
MPDLSPQHIDGRRALVCGASSGIGRAAALALARAGVSVVALARTRSKLIELAEEVVETGAPDLEAVPCDLENTSELELRVDRLIEEGGPIEILVNNAGGPPGGPLLSANEEDFLSPFRRHLLASHLLVRKLLPGMIERNYGRIINIISISVYEPVPNLGVSNTIRGAMAAWAKSLSNELPPGITINNVLPGYTDTDRLHELAGEQASRSGRTQSEIRRRWTESVPEGRLLDPCETAAAVVFLASPAAGGVRGISLPVDGGRLRGI